MAFRSQNIVYRDVSVIQAWIIEVHGANNHDLRKRRCSIALLRRCSIALLRRQGLRQHQRRDHRNRLIHLHWSVPIDVVASWYIY